MKKLPYIIAMIVIVLFAARGAMEFQNSTTPYVTSVTKARSFGDRQLQFIGSIDHKSVRYSDSSEVLFFNLIDDKGDVLRVRYTGIRPGNFDSAKKAVVRGSLRKNDFIADDLMLKCPSKYESR